MNNALLPLRGNHTNLAARLIQFNQTKAQLPRYELKKRPSGLPNRMEDNLLLFEYLVPTSKAVGTHTVLYS